MNTRILKIRQTVQMTQTEFGEAIGATRAMIASYESGKVTPDKTTRMLICEKFHVNQTWLETGNGPVDMENSSAAILRALDAMPDLKEAFAAYLPRITLEDMRTINEMVRKYKNKAE